MAPRILHYFVAMMLDLDFHTKYLDGVGDTINIFLFLYLSPSSGSYVDLLVCCWVTFLGVGTLT